MNWADKAKQFANDTRSMFFRPKHLSRFEYGAQWQRDQIRTNEAIERGARTIYENMLMPAPKPAWEDLDEDYKTFHRDNVEATIDALLGED